MFRSQTNSKYDFLSVLGLQGLGLIADGHFDDMIVCPDLILEVDSPLRGCQTALWGCEELQTSEKV